MNENTVFIYESSIGKLVFAHDSGLWISDIDGVSSVEIDISESRSAKQVGSSLTSQSVRSRPIPINGSIMEPLEINRERMISIMAPQMPATLTLKQGGESWYLDVVPKKTPDISPGRGLQYFQAVLHAAYPYWRTTSSYATQIAGLIAMFRFPFFSGGEWWVSKYSDSYFSTIDNKGNVPIEFQVEFAARSAIENPELYHMDTRKRILIRKNMAAGERIVVSTMYGSRGVICIDATGKVSNGFRHLSLDSDLSMALLSGENLLRIDASKNREGLSARIKSPKGVRSGV